MASKLDPYADEIFRRLSKESKASIARSLDVPPSTLKDFIENYDARENLPQDSQDEFVEIPVFVRDYSHLDKLNPIPLGDLHIGAPSHNQEKWEEWLTYLVNEPHTTLINTGDNLDAALKNSKSESYDATMTVGRAKRIFQSQIEPLAQAGRVDLLMPGNHEARIYRAVGDCPILDVAENLGLNYSQYAALILYKVGQETYRVYVRHGTGSGNGMIGSRANQLQRQAHVVEADVYISGHTHSQLASVDNVFVLEEERMVRKKRYYLSSGSFLNYEGYAAERAFVPGKIGAPRLFLDGTRHDIHVSI